MLNHFSKKRAPIAKLRLAAEFAQEVMVRRRISRKDNVLAEIAKEANAPILPGVPSYLPHRWTITAARKAMFELLKEWSLKHRGDDNAQENAPEFFAYAVKRIQFFERMYSREMRQTEASFKKVKKSRVIAEIFTPVRRRDTTRALHKFFVDSFAVFVIVKANGNTSEYAEWFLGEWTLALDSMWVKKADKKT